MVFFSKIRDQSATTCIQNYKWDTIKMNGLFTFQSRMTSSPGKKDKISIFSRFSFVTSLFASILHSFIFSSVIFFFFFYCVLIYKADEVALVWSIEFQIGNFYCIHPQNNFPACTVTTTGCHNLSPASRLKACFVIRFWRLEGTAETLLPFLQKGE